MRNYLKVAGEFVFFNDTKVVDTQAAYNKAFVLAKSDTSIISIFALPANAGPWDRVGIVGHRRRGEILADIDAAGADEQELEYREAELTRLDRLYFAAGRDCIPLFGVAA